MARPNLEASSTMFPDTAVIAVSTGARSLDEAAWTEMATNLASSLDAVRSARSDLDLNLKIWDALVEMDVPDSDDERWEDAANLFIPVVPSELRAMASYLSGQIFAQRFIIVSGNTQDASDTSNQVERYYNAELVRKRGQTTWLADLKTVLLLGLKDGTSVLEAVWRRTVRDKITPVFDPVLDENELPVTDEGGEPKTQRRMVTQRVVEYDDVHLEPVALKDFGLIPAEARSIDDAVGCYKVEWLYEDRLREMVAEDLLDHDWVEKILAYNPSGSSDVSADEDANYDKSAGGQIDMGMAQGTLVGDRFRNRGPFKMYRIHSKQYDMNGDKKPEENVFWVHGPSRFMAGWCPYEYVVPERPFFGYSPFPRPGRFYGYSLVELLQDLQAEINAIHNQRRDAIDLHLSPPFLEKQGVEIQNKGMRWGPNARWLTEDENAITVLPLPQMPPDAEREESLLNAYVAKVTGNDAPMLGGQSSSRRSATEARQKQAASTTRSADVAMNFRYFCRNVFDFIHRLKLQYLPDNPSFNEGDEKYVVPRAVLARDYRIEVAGASDPVDAASRRQEWMALLGIAMKFPDVMSNALYRHKLLKRTFELFDEIPDGFVGTDQEAQQRMEAEQQAAQAQQAAALAGAATGQPQQQGKPQGQSAGGGLASLFGAA